MIRSGDSYRMAGMKQMIFAIVFQGFYLGSVCQRWTFPERITALIGSCVEVPCTYRPPRKSGASSPVWYKYAYLSYPEILNTEDPFSVMEEYKDRTSLVPGNNSCTLRINPVRGEDGKNKYYPGIAEDKYINAFKKQQSRTVNLDVTDSPRDIHLYMSQAIREGISTNIRCTAYHTCGSRPPSIRWNKLGQITNRSVETSEGTWREESELTFIPSYTDNGTTIWCTATYPNGQQTETSSTLILSYSPQNVTIVIIGNKEAIEGSNVTLQCNSFSKPDVYKYEWYRGKEKTKLQFNGGKLGIRNVTRDVEPYSCIAVNAVGTGESALMEIPVLYAATGVRIIMTNKTDFTELTCDFLSCRPDVTHYTWMKDGSILQNKTEKTLTVGNKEQNYGQYSCIAHNRVGNSSSFEVYIKRDPVDLPLILGSVLGVFFLLLFILVIYFCKRKIYKSHFQPSQKHSLPARMLHNNTSVIEENQYGNICSHQNAQPSSMRSMSSVEVNVNENYAIYSNSDVLQTRHDVEYSDISHVQHDQITSAPRVSYAHNVDYAILRH